MHGSCNARHAYTTDMEDAKVAWFKHVFENGITLSLIHRGINQVIWNHLSRYGNRPKNCYRGCLLFIYRRQTTKLCSKKSMKKIKHGIPKKKKWNRKRKVGKMQKDFYHCLVYIYKIREILKLKRWNSYL